MRRPIASGAARSPTGACAATGLPPPATAASCTVCRCGATWRSPTRCSTARAASCSARPRTDCRRRWPCSTGCSPLAKADARMITHRSDPTLAIQAPKIAAPYVRLYKGKTFVVKAGGGVFADGVLTRALIEQIAILHFFGVRVVLVHGGGPQLNELATALGVPTRMVAGRRVTDEKSIDVAAMVLSGLLNTRVLAICRALNIAAVGISGVDAGLVRAHRRGPVSVDGELIDFGLVGDIEAIDAPALVKLLDAGLMPVVSPLSADESGTLLNINADTVAAALGAALGAEKLILCTGAPGILANVEDPGSLISYTDLRGLERLRAAGRIAAGMLPKAKAIEEALRGGVRRVHVVSYRSAEGILGEVFTNEGSGTLVVADIEALSPAEQQGST